MLPLINFISEMAELLLKDPYRFVSSFDGTNIAPPVFCAFVLITIILGGRQSMGLFPYQPSIDFVFGNGAPTPTEIALVMVCLNMFPSIHWNLNIFPVSDTMPWHIHLELLHDRALRWSLCISPAVVSARPEVAGRRPVPPQS